MDACDGLRTRVEREIDHDPVEPGREAGDAGIERRSATPDPQERVLADVVGLGCVADDALCDADRKRHVPPHENAEGALIALGDEFHEVLVGLAPGHALL